uniref:Protein HIDE1 isoform X4 n=1 Tax=Geotrypetes seraphini TaxID=260995 RepID=A0A6P8Q0M8_GEOSA|nr:protein HIDE1 isoform X4 [Geotrypetes seraphini]
MPPVTIDLLLEHTQTTNYSALPPMSVPPPVKASRRQKKREKESCWTQNTSTYPIDLTFDNVVFADPTSQKPSSDPQASSGPLSVSSLQFSTFRS